MRSFLELAESRCSTRAFTEDPVSEQDLQKILEAARLAPSASNRQPWHFVVVRDPQRRQALADIAGGQQFVGEAPVIIAGIALDPGRVMTCGVPAYAVDLAIAVDHMTLAAEDLGLGTCWIGLFDQEAAKEILEVPGELMVFTLLPLGYPAASPRPKKRKSLEEMVSHETYGGDRMGEG